ERTPFPATQRAQPPKGFEAQSRKGSQGSRGRLKAAATVKSFSLAAPPNSFWHERAVRRIKPGHKEMRFPCNRKKTGDRAQPGAAPMRGCGATPRLRAGNPIQLIPFHQCSWWNKYQIVSVWSAWLLGCVCVI